LDVIIALIGLGLAEILNQNMRTDQP
jgi:hypothetical protein